MQNITSKICSECGQAKPLAQFSYVKARHNYRNKCRQCLNKRQLSDYHKNKHRIEYRKYFAASNRKTHQRLKREVLSHYSTNNNIQCANLYHVHDGEIITDLDLLTLDHINGGGGKDKRLYGAGIYGRLKRANFPVGYQVLCWNCNWKKLFINHESKRHTTK